MRRPIVTGMTSGGVPSRLLRSSSRSAPSIGRHLPIDLLPQIVYPQIRVNIQYPGVAPKVMKEQVTKVLETALATTENLILMTTFTSILGVLPLALRIGEGTEPMQPPAVALVGGITVSTALTLLVVPAVYLQAHAITDRIRRAVIGSPDESSHAAAEPEFAP